MDDSECLGIPRFCVADHLQPKTTKRYHGSRQGMEYLLDDPNELGRLLRLLKELMKILETYGVLDAPLLRFYHVPP